MVKYAREIYTLYCEKEEIMMKNIIKYGIVGVAGYLVGFYEMKYKVMKALLKSKLEDEESK
jgi:hypothetical protein